MTYAPRRAASVSQSILLSRSLCQGWVYLVHDIFIRVRTNTKDRGSHDHQGVSYPTALGMSIFTSDQVGHDEETKTPDGDHDALENESTQTIAKRGRPKPTNTCVQWYFVLIYIQLENRHTGIDHL